MKFISNSTVLKIPSEIKCFYCKNKQILAITSNKKQKVLKLEVKIFISETSNSIVVTNQPFVIKSNNYKKAVKSLQFKTLFSIKKSFEEFSTVYCKKLKLSGVGYKVFELNIAHSDMKCLNFKLGYSHDIFYKIPKKVLINTRLSNKIFLFGSSPFGISTEAAKIRSLKVPEPYKGKGILYGNEKIVLKEGKKV
jgi:large subunit ribosomal protein L6